MKKMVTFVFLSLIFFSCKKDSVQSIEEGTYEAYQSLFINVSTVTKKSISNVEISDCKPIGKQFKFPSVPNEFDVVQGNPVSSYFVYTSTDLNGDSIHIVDLNEGETSDDKLTLKIEKDGTVSLVSLCGLSTKHIINRENDQILLSIADKGTIVRFSPKPFDQWNDAMVIQNDNKDYEKYSTIQGYISDSEIILYLFDIRLIKSGFSSSSTDLTYIDTPLIQQEIQEGDVFQFVKKAVYFKRQ